MEHGDVLDQIFKISPAIRFVGLYDSNSEKITDDFQPGVLQHLSREEMRDSTRYDGKRWDTYKMFQRQLGEPNFAMVKYDKIIQATFPVSDGVRVRVSMEPDSDFQGIMQKIQNLLVKVPLLGMSLLTMDSVMDSLMIPITL